MSQTSLIGQNLFDLMKSSDEKELSNDIWTLAKPILASGKEWIGEVKFTRSDGQIAFSNMILSPVLNTKGKLAECIVMHNDLSERKEFTRKISETQKQYRSIVESSLDGIMVIQNGQKLAWNENFSLFLI